jgi:geranylgeranyl diphosphate synthase type I
MACQLGAAVVTDNPEILGLVGEFGEHIGMVGQLLNDMAGASRDAVGRGSDLARRKKTLPVAFALRVAREEGIQSLLDWYGGAGERMDERRVADLIHSVGGIHFAWVVARAHRQEALATLRVIRDRTGRAEVLRLRRLVPRVQVVSHAGGGDGGR